MLALAKGADRASFRVHWNDSKLESRLIIRDENESEVECHYLVRTVWADNIIVHEASFRVLQVT